MSDGSLPAALESRSQQRFLADDISLAHELVEAAGPHPLGQRCVRFNGVRLVVGKVEETHRLAAGHGGISRPVWLPRPVTA